MFWNVPAIVPLKNTKRKGTKPSIREEPMLADARDCSTIALTPPIMSPKGIPYKRLEAGRCADRFFGWRVTIRSFRWFDSTNN